MSSPGQMVPAQTLQANAQSAPASKTAIAISTQQAAPEAQKEPSILEKIDLLCQSPPYEIFMTVLTFLVLYADDVRMVALTKNEDNGYYYFMLVSFFIFLVEIVLLSVIRPGYLFSFFFWMDVASTLSTVMEIPMVMSGLLGIQAFSNNKSTKLAKAGKASRVSSKATKVIRVVRLIRLVRIAKLYKYAYKGIEAKLQQSQTMINYEKEYKNDDGQNRMDGSQDDQEEIEVLQYNQKMIPKPRIMPTVQQSDTNRAGKVQGMGDTDRMPIVTPPHHSTIRIDMTGNKTNDPRMLSNTVPDQIEQKSMRAQLIEIGEKPIHYEEQNSDDSQSEKNLEDDLNNEENKFLEQGGAQGAQVEVETQVGKLLSDLTTRRAIMVMFSVMISIPLLSYDTYFADLTAYDTGLIYLENTYQINNNPEIQSKYKDGFDVYKSVAVKIDGVKLLLLKVEQEANVEFLDKINSLRDEEMNQYVSPSGTAVALLDGKYISDMNSYLGLIRTTFVIVVLVLGAIMFSQDSNDLVVAPIESMLSKVKRIAKNPLEAAHIEEDMAIAEEHLKKQNMDDKLVQEKMQRKGFETAVLERLIVKTGALLAIGFGDAGSGVIAQNMNLDGDVNPMIAGKKIFAIFGFCDIRNFIDMTEILEERVMVFVNEVADIVHNSVNNYEGSTNKNIGDAFLLVWKFPPDVLKMNKDYPEILNLRMVNNIADMALIAFIKTFINVRKSYNIEQYYQLPEVQEKLPNFHVKMGFGLHVGWAIEGAIGSMFKIDASYLSPNVNMASRLEAATKQYGVFHLVSGPFYRLLSNLAQSKMRHLDRVTVKGSIQPVDFFSFDIDLDKIPIGSEERKPIKNKKIQRYFERRARAKRMEQIRKEKLDINTTFQNDIEIHEVQKKFTEIFYSTFHDGINSYLQGRWPYAKSCLEKTKTMLGSNDGPSITILNYMNNFDYDAPEEWKGYRELVDK